MTADPTMTAEDPFADAPLSAPQTEQAPEEPGEPESPGEERPAPDAGDLALVPTLDLLTLNDPLAVAELCRGLTAELTARIDAVAELARLKRPEGKPSATLLGPELRDLAAASDVLKQLARVMGGAAAHAAYRATDAMVDVLGEGRRTAKVPDGHGSEITASLTPRMETSADEDALLDVLATYRFAAVGPEVDSTDPTVLYAAGVRDGMAVLRQHLPATVPWKTTELAKTSKALASVGEDALAARLDSAWARVEVGEPTAKLDVKAPRA